MGYINIKKFKRLVTSNKRISANAKPNLLTYINSILLLVVIVNIYRYILTIYKDIINNLLLLLERTRVVIKK